MDYDYGWMDYNRTCHLLRWYSVWACYQVFRALSCVSRCSHTPTGDPKVDGPVAWAALFDACKLLGPNCECREMCFNGLRAFKDLVNFHLGKPIHYRANLGKMAAFYQKAISGCRGASCA